MPLLVFREYQHITLGERQNDDSSLHFLLVQVFTVQTLMWFKLFDWLRLFGRTAIYPVLLQEVLQDILPYGVMMMIIFGLFSNGMFIFQARAIYEGDSAMVGLRSELG